MAPDSGPSSLASTPSRPSFPFPCPVILYTRGLLLVQLWHKDPERKSQECKWSGVGGDSDNPTQFEWKYKQHQLIEEESTLSNANRAVNVSCTTHNRLMLPDVSTLSDGKLVISMSGELRLRLQSALSHESWSMELIATWSVSVVMKTSVEGVVEVDIEGPNIDAPPSKAPPRWRTPIFEVPTTLRGYLPGRHTFDKVLKELKNLQGEWKYYYPMEGAFTLCTPTFNGDGDIFFEFRRSQQTVPSWRPSHYANGRLPVDAPRSPQDTGSSQASEGSGGNPAGQERQENAMSEDVHPTPLEPKSLGQGDESANDMTRTKDTLPFAGSGSVPSRSNARITSFNSRA